LWSVARYDLRLSSAEFYRLTPRQLDALIKRQEHGIRHSEFMLAQLTACVANFSMSHPKKPVDAKDFMPSEWAKVAEKEPKAKKRSRHAIAGEIRATMDAWMKGISG
jgi:hypothetical protein